MKSGSYPREYWKGFVFVLLAFTIHQLIAFMPAVGLIGVLKKWPKTIGLMLMLSVYSIGAYILVRSGANWMNTVWHVVHIALISLVLIILCYKRFIGPFPLRDTTTLWPIIHFVISPIPYLGMGLIYRASRTFGETQTSQDRL